MYIYIHCCIVLYIIIYISLKTSPLLPVYPMAYSWCFFGFAASSVLPGISEDHRPISIGKEIKDI